MLRKHLPTIVYLTLLIASAVPYGMFLAAARLPFWLASLLAVVWGTVVSIASDAAARAIRNRLHDRAYVQAQGGDR